MAAAKANLNQSVDWIVCGWCLFRAQTGLWLGMALVYLVIAFLLRLIPFMGDLVLILISPILLAGTLLTARAADRPARVNTATVTQNSGGPDTAPEPVRWRLVLLRPARSLFQTFTHSQKLPVAMIACVLVLGLVMLLKIVEYIVIGGSLRTGLNFAQIATNPRPVTLIGMLIILLLYLLLAMALYYLVHLSMLGEHNPMNAMAESFTACKRNVLPLSIFTGVYVLPCLLIAVLFRISTPLGYLSAFTLGLVVLPNFVLGTYCSYKDLFETGPARPGDAPA